MPPPASGGRGHRRRARPGGHTIRLTFDQLAEEVASATRAIVANGIDRGDRVAIWAPNCAEWVVAAWAPSAPAPLLVPLNTRYKGAEAAYILRESGSPAALHRARGSSATTTRPCSTRRWPPATRCPTSSGWSSSATGDDGPRRATAKGDPVVAWEVFLAARAGLLGRRGRRTTASVTAGDLSDLVFTSGTTGRSQGGDDHPRPDPAHLRHLVRGGRALREGDRYLIVNPFFHTFGYKAGILACLMTGATMVPEPVFDVDRRAATGSSEERISVLPGPPTIFQSMLDHPDRKSFDLSTLRLVVTGAAVVPVELVGRCGPTSASRRCSPPTASPRPPGR